jgi:hypothetical protein
VVFMFLLGVMLPIRKASAVVGCFSAGEPGTGMREGWVTSRLSPMTAGTSNYYYVSPTWRDQ